MQVIYTLSYWRTLRRIVEEPDIAPGRSRSAWLPRLGNPVQTAIGQFTLRSVARSRQHRLILAFYLGIGLAFPTMRGMQLWIASILLMVLAVLGTRVAFALPLDLRANWIFRAIGVRSGLPTLTASRRTLLLLSVIPVWLATAAMCLWIWPAHQNLGHLAVLGFLGLILADTCLLRFRKIPFTCSWLPGKSRVNMALAAALFLMSVGSDIVAFERKALWSTRGTFLILSTLAIVWIGIRRFAVTSASREEEELQFEDEVALEVMGLGLYRDGVMTIDNLERSRRL